jgi:hypothetical protein
MPTIIHTCIIDVTKSDFLYDLAYLSETSYVMFIVQRTLQRVNSRVFNVITNSEVSSMLHWDGSFSRLFEFVSRQTKIKKAYLTLGSDDDRQEHSPQLHAKLFLYIIVVPIILPQLVSLRLCCSGGNPSEVRQIRLGVVPI